MKSKKMIVTTANLNTGTEQSINLGMTVENGLIKIPSEIVVVNNTAATIGIMFIDSEADLDNRTANPTMYEFVPLNAGISSVTLPSYLKYIIVKLLSGTAVANLDIYGMNYNFTQSA